MARPLFVHGAPPSRFEGGRPPRPILGTIPLAKRIAGTAVDRPVTAEQRCACATRRIGEHQLEIMVSALAAAAVVLGCAVGVSDALQAGCPVAGTSRFLRRFGGGSGGGVDDRGEVGGGGGGSCRVVVSGVRYDLTPYVNAHPGGPTLLTRHDGEDITALFFSNHLKAPVTTLERFRTDHDNDIDGIHPSANVSHAIAVDYDSPVYAELKARVADRLAERGLTPRHSFGGVVLGLRLACVALALALVPHSGLGAGGSLAAGGWWAGSGIGAGGASAVAVGAIYGYLMGLQTWTHAHNGVHNPDAMAPSMVSLD